MLHTARAGARPEPPLFEVRPLVLHVAEAWGGGVVTAVHDYMLSTPGYDHALLCAERPGEATGAAFDDAVAVLPLSGKSWRSVRDVERAVRELRPDIVHAHSSFAGVFVRLARGVPTPRTVYTPHCYAFERTDVRPAVRGAMRTTERVLLGSTGAVAACSPREAELARGLRRRPRGTVAYVPNVVRLEAGGSRTPTGGLHVAALGRLTAQKDPGFFREVVQTVHAADPTVRFTWLGGGPPAETALLESAGVEVSGWRPRDEVCQRLREADAYLHTAAWEGAPLALLEAAALSLPLVGRRIPALTSLGLRRLGDDPGSVAEQLLLLRDPEHYQSAVLETQELTARHTPEAQAEALNELYASVLTR